MHNWCTSLLLVLLAVNISVSQANPIDVVVIGGGPSGTYAAVRLKDQNKSVIVVEQDNRLGGNTNTYFDPITGRTDDYGVIYFDNLSIVKQFFSRFNIPLQTTQTSGGTRSIVADFRTGATITVPPTNPQSAIQAYAAQLQKYPTLEAGYFLPDPVPDELIAPFGEFIQKYNLDLAVYTIYQFCQGVGDFLSKPTLYILKLFGLPDIQALQSGFLVTQRFNNQELYDKALAYLGSSVYLGSTVINTDRRPGYVKLLIQTPQGEKFIQAKKILISVAPKLENLRWLDLDYYETSLFGKFTNSYYYNGVIRNSGIPSNLSISNISPELPYVIPKIPNTYVFTPPVSQTPGLTNVYYGSKNFIPLETVKATILRDLSALAVAGTIQKGQPEFSTFGVHAPFELVVSAKDIKAGFYNKLYQLQGRKNTYYTGAAFHVHNSGRLWNFTEAYVLPQLLAQ